MSDRRTARRRPRASTQERGRRTAFGSTPGPRPDRVAAWAVALGVFMILVASATARAASTGGAEQPTGRPDDGGAGLAGSPPSRPEAVPSGVSRSELLGLMSVRRASSYGPGFYGRRTACGVRLRRSTQGVAHRSLPCGSVVTFHYRERFRTVPVIDRGPYVRGVAWDLTVATARSLGLRGSGSIRALAW